MQNTCGIWNKHRSLIYHVIFYGTGKLHNLPVLHFGTDATFETNVISDVRQLWENSRDFVALDYSGEAACLHNPQCNEVRGQSRVLLDIIAIY